MYPALERTSEILPRILLARVAECEAHDSVRVRGRRVEDQHADAGGTQPGLEEVESGAVVWVWLCTFEGGSRENVRVE